MGLWETIKAEWPIVSAAPWSFGGVLIGGLIVGFSVGMVFRAQEVANAESLVRLRDAEISLKDTELSGFRKSVEDRLKNVEQKLSAQQISFIETALKTKPSTVSIYAGGKASEDYVKQVKDVFTNSGWTVQAELSHDTQRNLTVKTANGESAGIVTKALEGAEIKYESIELGGANGETIFYLGSSEK